MADSGPQMPDVVGFAAYSGTGKTTLVSQVIPELRRQGLSIGVIKHAHHSFEIDTPGKDSHEFRKAGAQQVLIASRNRAAWIVERDPAEEPRLADLVGQLCGSGLDLIVVEGFKHEPFPKIEVHRADRSKALLATADPHVIAVATDSPERVQAEAQTLDLNEPAQVAEFILRRKRAGALRFPSPTD